MSEEVITVTNYLQEKSLEDTFLEAMKLANPLASNLAPHVSRDLEKNFSERISHVPKHLAKKIILWTAGTKYKDVFFADQPVWAFLREWNKISSDYLNSITQKTMRSTTSSSVSRVESDEEYKARCDFDSPSSPYFTSSDIKPPPQVKSETQKNTINRQKAEQMRLDMEKLGLYNSEVLNDILINHDVPPLIDETKPTIKGNQIFKKLSGDFRE